MFQSLIGIIEDFDATGLSFRLSLPVSIPDRDYRGFRPQLWNAGSAAINVSIPDRDYRGFRPGIPTARNSPLNIVSIPDRDYRGFRLNFSFFLFD
mgnify:CR=1 FL=1